jgi:hypothetical protein
MAHISASVYTSHVPAIGAALDMGLRALPPQRYAAVGGCCLYAWTASMHLYLKSAPFAGIRIFETMSRRGNIAQGGTPCQKGAPIGPLGHDPHGCASREGRMCANAVDMPAIMLTS